MNDPSDNYIKQPDFTIVFRKISEAKAESPELMAEIHRVAAETAEIKDLRRAVSEVSNDPPTTLTLS